jgi:hypothetical protein
MRRDRLGALAFLLLGASCALWPASCSLATDGTGGASPPPIEGGGGGGGSEVGGTGGTAAGAGPGGAGGAGAGAPTGGGAGAGGAGGVGGAGGAGGPIVPVAPKVLDCTIWLPSDPAWGLGGDARKEEGRIVLTPPDAQPRLRWGQAYLPFLIDVGDVLEVAFTFDFEPGGAGDYGLGAAFWFATPSEPFPPVDMTFDVTLGVPPADGGVALVLDLRPPAPPATDLSWRLFANPFGDNRTLGGWAYDGTPLGTNLVSAAAPAAGTHTTIVRLSRDADLDTDDVDITATFVTPPGAPAIAGTFTDGEDEVLAPAYVGFSAGSGEGAGAAHALLGVEIKVDGACRNPP